MGTSEKCFVQFFSPGTLFSEITSKPIDTWDTHLACDMAKTITERHKALHYGFRFVTELHHTPVDDGLGGELEVEPRQLRKSAMYFITGRLLKFEDVEKMNEDESNTSARIMLSNMQSNRWPVCIENRNSSKFTCEFEPEDMIVDEFGNIIICGNSLKLMEYRTVTIAKFDKYWKEQEEKYAQKTATKKD